LHRFENPGSLSPVKRQLSRLIYLLLGCVAGTIVALALAWEAVEIDERAHLARARETKEVVQAGIAGAPIAVPLLVQLHTLVTNR